MKKARHIIRMITAFTAVVALTGCAAQLALNVALKRDAAKDRRRYEQRFDKYSARYPEWMAAFKDTCMTSPNNGARLHAIYMAAPQPTSKTAFILHGHTGNCLDFVKLAKWYNEEMGYNLFMPDFYAHGLSEGKMRQMGWLDRWDFIEWIRMANNIFSCGGEDTRMVVTGISMGGAGTMMVSAEIEKQGLNYVKCLIEDCGYTSFYAEAEYVAPNIKVAPKDSLKRKAMLDDIDRTCKKKYGWSFSEASSLSQVSKCTLPMLFIHGDADTYVPTSMVYEVYQAKPGTKELLIVPGAKHARAAQSDIYRTTVTAYLAKYID